MTNRHERRKAAKLQQGDVILVDYAHILERDPNYSLPVTCYVCDTVHKALGLAFIRQKRSVTDIVPLCKGCFDNPLQESALIRKYTKADLQISDGGEITNEQLSAMVDRQDTIEH